MPVRKMTAKQWHKTLCHLTLINRQSGFFVNNINLRQILPSDSKPVFKIETDSYRFPWSESDILCEIQNNFSKNFLLENKNQIVGYIFSHIVVDQIQINNVCIDKNYRGNGYAKLLLNSVFNNVKKTGVKHAFLEVRETNIVAFKLYCSIGFKKDCIRKKYYSDGDNAILMSKVL